MLKLLQEDGPLQNGTPIKMHVACLISCVLGTILMVWTSHYLLAAALIFILVCTIATALLFSAGKIGIEAACLTPMVLLCFVYTPISWYTLDGLMGCTPYLSILFSTLVIFTYYHRIQTIILSLYAALMFGLIVHWLVVWHGQGDAVHIIHVLVAYILVGTLNVSMAEGIKRKNHEINQRIADLSARDDLTGLLNRRLSEQILIKMEEAFQGQNSVYAVVILDLDKFKSINDLYGHNLGDLALKSMAVCIQENIRPADYAFRIGGDEFMLVLPSADGMYASQICERVTAALCAIRGFSFTISASIGYALRSEATCKTEVLELADQRMYMSKRNRSDAARPDASARPGEA